MFDLNTEILRWRKDLAGRDVCHTRDLDELEDHLREEIGRLSRAGLSHEEAFLIATHRLGPNGELSSEFAKVNPAPFWSRRFFWMVAGALMYLFIMNFAGAVARGSACLAAFQGLRGYELGGFRAIV